MRARVTRVLRRPMRNVVGIARLERIVLRPSHHRGAAAGALPAASRESARRSINAFTMRTASGASKPMTVCTLPSAQRNRPTTRDRAAFRKSGMREARRTFAREAEGFRSVE